MIVALLCIACVPRGDVIEDVFDGIEINHLFDSEGRHVFSQHVFWDWSDERETHLAQAWRFARKYDRYSCGRWTWIMFDDNGQWRRVGTRRYFETWTTFDPETQSRELLPVSERKGLSK